MIIDESSGKAVAVGRLQFNSEGEAQIRYMAVADEFQGQGLGSQSISALEDVAGEKGSRKIILQSRENALKFYEKNGYKIIINLPSDLNKWNEVNFQIARWYINIYNSFWRPHETQNRFRYILFTLTRKRINDLVWHD